MMTNKNRALTLAVLLSCSSMMMPFYAYAEDLTISEDRTECLTISDSPSAVIINSNITT